MTPVTATTALTQTLTCNIGDVAKDVTVSWKDKDGGAVTSGAGGYTIAQGSADATTKIQKSTLEITAATLAALSVTEATFKCAAKSKEYADSAVSGDQDVVVSFLTFGEYLSVKPFGIFALQIFD